MPMEVYKEHLELTTVIGCKSNCKYCPQDIFLKRYFEIGDKNNKPTELTLESCMRYLSTVPKDLTISLAGFSEPLVCKNMIEIYKFLIEDGRRVDVNTSLYNVERETLKGMMDVGIRYINIHLPDKDNYTDIQVDLEYVNKLRFLLNYCKTNNVNVIITCLGEMDEKLLDVVNRYDNISGKNIGRFFINDRSGLVENGIANKYEYKFGKINCCKTFRNLNYTVLLPDGSIVLCCMDFGLTNILGNLNDHSYEYILNDTAANKIRSMMDEEDSDLICRKCDFAYQI